MHGIPMRKSALNTCHSDTHSIMNCGGTIARESAISCKFDSIVLFEVRCFLLMCGRATARWISVERETTDETIDHCSAIEKD